MSCKKKKRDKTTHQNKQYLKYIVVDLNDVLKSRSNKRKRYLNRLRPRFPNDVELLVIVGTLIIKNEL